MQNFYRPPYNYKKLLVGQFPEIRHYKQLILIIDQTVIPHLEYLSQHFFYIIIIFG